MARVLFSAQVVCPMTGPPLGEGGVLVDGERIAAVGEAAVLRSEAGREYRIDGVLLPGLVNAHTHLEFAEATAAAEPGPHHRWLRALTQVVSTWTHDQWARSARRGVTHALRLGSTCVGDVVTRGPAVPASCRAGLLGDSWVEIADVDVRDQDEVLAALRSTLSLPAPGRRVGVAPRSPSVLGTGMLQALAALAGEVGMPLHTHAGESQSEVRAIWHGDGPIADLARAQGFEYEWLDGGTGLGPVRYLAQCGGLRPGASLAHGIWVDDAEAELLADQRVPVVCCPRAGARLQTGEPPLERYARAGTPLALGTESLAAVPDLDVLAEAAEWVRIAREQGVALWPGPAGPVELEEQALRLATLDGAAAMGWGEQAGVLAPGRRADLVAVDVPATTATAYREVIESGPGRQVLTVVAGVRRSWRSDGDAPWPPLEDGSGNGQPFSSSGGMR